MNRRTVLLAGAPGLLLSLPTTRAAPLAAPSRAGSAASLEEQVRAAERAFARSMALRDFDAFVAHVAEDAVFVNGGTPLRGKTAVAAQWKRFYDGPDAPFSWEPDLVVVTAGGELGYSTGPVTSPDGSVSNRFASTWRREPDGVWRVVFDNGYPICGPKT